MRKKELYINGKDAYLTWGAWMDEKALSALMTPAGLKEDVYNESRLKPGKQAVGTTPVVAARDLSLTVCIRASTHEQFLSRYASLTQELQGGAVNIKTRYQPNITYRCRYISCQQFTQFNGRLGKYMLKLNEPDPTNRN